MDNKYIEVVKRWQAGEVFSVQELMANAEAAADAEDALWDDEDASHATAAAANDAADHWVKRYEELTDG